MGEKDQTADANTECGWLVTFTFENGRKDHRFVRAPSVGEAHLRAISKVSYLKDTFAYAIEAYPLDLDAVREIMPDLKELARFYWYAALENVGVSRGDSDEEYFEATWQDHGVTLDDGQQ